MSDDYEVGYGKPPKAHRFPKGQSGNPAGRPKKYKSPISVLEAPIDTMVKGKRTKVPPFEAALRKTAQHAIDGKIRMIKRFLDHCESAGLLSNKAREPRTGVFYPAIDPANYPWYEFNADELEDIERRNRQREKELFGPEPLSEEAEIIHRVALERHWLASQSYKMTVLELVQHRLKHLAFKEDSEAALSLFMTLSKKTTLDINAKSVGVLLLPARTPPWLTRLTIIDGDTDEIVKPIGPGHPQYDPSRPDVLQSVPVD